ncbi:MAG: hypothetical protein ACRC9R_04830, partial [Enterovibrio sp.]
QQEPTHFARMQRMQNSHAFPLSVAALPHYHSRAENSLVVQALQAGRFAPMQQMAPLAFVPNNVYSPMANSAVVHALQASHLHHWPHFSPHGFIPHGGQLQNNLIPFAPSDTPLYRHYLSSMQQNAIAQLTPRIDFTPRPYFQYSQAATPPLAMPSFRPRVSSTAQFNPVPSSPIPLAPVALIPAMPAPIPQAPVSYPLFSPVPMQVTPAPFMFLMPVAPLAPYIPATAPASPSMLTATAPAPPPALPPQTATPAPTPDLPSPAQPKPALPAPRQEPSSPTGPTPRLRSHTSPIDLSAIRRPRFPADARSPATPTRSTRHISLPQLELVPPAIYNPLIDPAPAPPSPFTQVTPYLRLMDQ